ncbi:hypothetical protein PQ455_01430 [Sphingomonas naphthae]|uniref:Uncharacterized protein n=1 Tax=Sphingomonas naphthae TaxID=1813468 RepID=A0ABY7TL06_9SPHN|nr:hypothetical protein [Sphingomonas naphthae]WCT73922.1 hypothetical protein PQ455_01430 [Sphingomonas naphthae]
MRQDVVTFGGADEGGEIFNMHFERPAGDRASGLATSRMINSVAAFYGLDLGDDAARNEVHALLAYRDYAKASAEAIFAEIYGASRVFMLARFIAAFIGSQANIADDVTRWSNNRWRAGADPDTAPRDVRRTKHFPAIEVFARCAVMDMRDAGSKAF